MRRRHLLAASLITLFLATAALASRADAAPERRVNLSISPLGWLAGFLGASASVAVTDRLVLKADGNYYGLLVDGNGAWDGHEIGLSAPFYLARAYQGPFLEPGFIRREVGASCGDFDERCDDGVDTGPQLLLGWHWLSRTGLNAAVAIGGGIDVGSHAASNQSQRGDPFLNGFARVGYAF
jgi:hypothetical protein